MPRRSGMSEAVSAELRAYRVLRTAMSEPEAMRMMDLMTTERIFRVSRFYEEVMSGRIMITYNRDHEYLVAAWRVSPYLQPAAPAAPAAPRILAYEDVDDAAKATIQSSWTQDDMACSICMEDLRENDFSKRVVAVFHGSRCHFFHTDCWVEYETRSSDEYDDATCCNCRGEVERLVELPPPPPNYHVCGCR